MIDIDAVLSRGQKVADEVEIFVARYDDLAVEQHEREVSSVFEHNGQNIYIRIVKNGKMGVSATSDPTKLDACLRSAVSSANLSDTIPNWRGFVQKGDIPAGKDPVDATMEITSENAVEYLQRMNAGAEMYKEARVVTGGVTLMKGSSVLTNTNGVYLEREFTDISLGIDAICDGSTGYDNDSSPFANRINPEAIGERATFFASASRNGKALKSRKYDVVFSEDVVDSLILELFTEAVNGKNVMTGQSVYAEKLHVPVVSPKISIRDEPQNPAGNAWKRFDSEG
ncbi:MAG TPA: metallopeptidase TldD-related protein, partial [Methanocorpusculum sp.]|nr:metallopeptidase TldD-related protein [Methanocorpusculum sp.]